MEQTVAILDIGSGKVVALIVSRGVNGTLNVKGRGISEYDGFMGSGDWIDEPRDVSVAVMNAINMAEESAHTKINKIYVGVPGTFCRTRLNVTSTAFPKRRKVIDSDVDLLHNQGYNFNETGYTLINVQPVYYELEDGSKMIDPVGSETSSLSAQISYVFAHKSFTNLFDSIFSATNIKDYTYCSSILSQALYLFDGFRRDRYAFFMDVGKLVGDFVIARGDGLLTNYSFDVGGGYLSCELQEALNIPFDVAEYLKTQVILSLDSDDTSVYEFSYQNQRYRVPQKITNEIVKTYLDEVVGYVEYVLSNTKIDIPSAFTIYLTGNGIAPIRGAARYISDMLEIPVEVVLSKQPLMEDLGMSSAYGLSDMVLNSIPDLTLGDKIVGFIKRLFTGR